MTSCAPNQIKGTVVEIREGVTTTHVRIDIFDDRIVTSGITQRSAGELGSAPGNEAYPVITSSGTMGAAGRSATARVH